MSDIERAQLKELGFEITELGNNEYLAEFKRDRNVIIVQAQKERLGIEIITSLLSIVSYYNSKRDEVKV